MEMAEYCLATSNKRKKSKNDKRRFSDEQIRCLEVMFESETKLDPRKKVEVARELGLQPRQVAIWFQNKRARWKSKHIEKEYALLLADYNNLAAQFESLNKEKHSLLLQLQKVKSEISRGKGGDEKEIHELEGGARYGSSDGEESDSVKIDLLQVKNSVSDDDSIDINQQKQQQQQLLQLRDEDDELLRMVDTSDWGTLDSDDIIINQATQTSCHWRGFWS